MASSIFLRPILDPYITKAATRLTTARGLGVEATGQHETYIKRAIAVAGIALVVIAALKIVWASKVWTLVGVAASLFGVSYFDVIEQWHPSGSGGAPVLPRADGEPAADVAAGGGV